MTHAKKAEWSPRVIEGSRIAAETIEWVRVDELVTPPEYQRILDDAWVRFLVSHYDASRMLVIVVSRRLDGTLVIVDGQHRVAALRLLGVQVVHAIVHEGLTAVEEANLFEDLNRNRHAPTTFDLFRAKVAGERPDAIAITAIAADFGYTFHRGGAVAHSIQAVGAVEAIYRQGGSDLLRSVLRITSGPWAGSIEGVEGQMLRGLAMFLRAYMAEPSFSFDRLASALSHRHPLEILKSARGIAIETGRAGATNGYAPYVLAFLKIYNRDLGATSRYRIGSPRLNDRALPARGRIGRTR
jgi:hypothetical protein